MVVKLGVIEYGVRKNIRKVNVLFRRRKAQLMKLNNFLLRRKIAIVNYLAINVVFLR